MGPGREVGREQEAVMANPGALRILAVFLCLLMSVPALPQTPSAAVWPAGNITTMIPGANRNSTPAKAKQEIYPGDTIRTDHTGRARVTLRDGSVLSLGPDTELKVVQHEAGSQVTVLELESGRLRSRVVPVKQGGKFEIVMPHSVVHVVGTDFFLSAQANGNMQLIVYSGRVWLSGTGPDAGKSATVEANQMIELNASGMTAVRSTPPSVQEDSIASTSTEAGTAGTSAAAGANSNLLRNLLIGVGVAATGIAIAVGKGAANHSATTTTSAGTKPVSSSTAPAPQNSNPKH